MHRSPPRRRVGPAAVAATAVAVLATTAAPANEFLEVGFEHHIGGSVPPGWAASFTANKAGATTAVLTTVRGVYPCFPVSDEWYPPPAFWTDHRGLTWSEFAAVVAGGWTCVWDAGLPTETVAQIGFGSIEETDFPLVPEITTPPDGALGVDPKTAIDWSYGGTDPCDAQVDRVEVCIEIPPAYSCTEMDSCDATSWTPPAPFPAGDQTVVVTNAIDVRDVADGIGGPITGDPWVLENQEWLALQGLAITTFRVLTTSVETSSFGRVKARYRAGE